MFTPLITRSLTLFALPVFSFLIAVSGVSATSIDDLISSFETDIPELQQQYDVPGVGVALIEDGETVWMHGFGYTDLDSTELVDSTSVFQVGRLTELITAMGILVLVDEGRIQLDQPFWSYVSQWKFSSTGYNHEEVTIRRLLNHSAGIAPIISKGFQAGESYPGLISYLEGQTNLMGKVSLSYEPGSKFTYSAGGYALLQLIVENVTEQNFCDYMRRRILEPLGMHQSGFTCRQVDTAKAVTSYTSRHREIPQYRHTAQAAVGLRTTIHDFALFVSALLESPDGNQPGRGLLSPSLLTEMYRPQGPSNGQYGLGCCLTPLEWGGEMIHQCCGMHGWRAQAAVVPDQQRGLIIFSNVPAGEKLIRKMFSSWCQMYDLSCIPCAEKGQVSRARVTTINILITGVILVLLLFVGFMGWKARHQKQIR